MWPFSRAEHRNAAVEEAPPVYPNTSREPSTGHAWRAAQLAAVEGCVRMICAAFDGCTVRNAPASLTPCLLADLTRRVLIRGQALAMIEVREGMIRLAEASTWHVEGGQVDPMQWRYVVHVAAPSGVTSVRQVPGSGVVHLRWSTRPEAPDEGFSPIYNAARTFGLAAVLDRSIDCEAQTPTGQAMSLSMPSDDPETGENYMQHYQGLDRLDGGLFVERQSRIDGQRSSGGFMSRLRIGPEFSQYEIALRDAVARQICGAFGVPCDLLDASEGAADRESYRRFILSTVMPLAVRYRTELRMKLDAPELDIGFEGLRGHDVQNLGRGIHTMTQAGVPLADALRWAGLDPE